MSMPTHGHPGLGAVPAHELLHWLADLRPRRATPAVMLDAVLPGTAPPPGDSERFRVLMEDTGGNDEGGMRDADRRPERSPYRAETRDDVARACPAHRGARDAGHATDGGVSDAIDVPAVCAVVTQAYFESRRERRDAVHLVLDDALLPATRLSLFERDGRLAVDFVSTNAATRRRLCRGAPALAARVAADLARDVLVRVAAHERDRLALEVGAAAPIAGGVPPGVPLRAPFGGTGSRADGGMALRPSPEPMASLSARRPR